MPDYDYRCMLCNETTTYTRKIEDRDLEAKCHSCNQPAQRTFNPVNAVFKGGGFYSTDKNDK
jgi:putative FmdB family regulatory protein